MVEFISQFEGLGDLDGAVASIVEEAHRVAVFDLADGFSLTIGEHKWRQVLIDHLLFACHNEHSERTERNEHHASVTLS